MFISVLFFSEIENIGGRLKETNWRNIKLFPVLSSLSDNVTIGKNRELASYGLSKQYVYAFVD